MAAVAVTVPVVVPSIKFTEFASIEASLIVTATSPSFPVIAVRFASITPAAAKLPTVSLTPPLKATAPVVAAAIVPPAAAFAASLTVMVYA